MTSKYPSASLWRMKKTELLAITEAESLIIDPNLTRAKIISEITKIEAIGPLVPTKITEKPAHVAPPIVELPAYEEEEMTDYPIDDLPPASVRVRRIRKLSE